jgi:sugar phosphate isomerase/epimerase
VFGCPKNRAYPGRFDAETAHSFFYSLGSFALEHNTVLAIEANPVIYNTNFLNTTSEALDFVKKINCEGLKVNLDFGTIIQNNENIDDYSDDIFYINHIHISEPNLELIQKRSEHKKLADMLKEKCYSGYVSIEMKNHDIEKVHETLLYVKSVFGE